MEAWQAHRETHKALKGKRTAGNARYVARLAENTSKFGPTTALTPVVEMPADIGQPKKREILTFRQAAEIVL
ncbi:MAG TPA: hypothetical protein VH684_16695 [Xanthobacteraceae bacterium]|jgi:hypothetical protein